MRKLILIPLTLAVAACGQSARNETAEAADTLSADMNATRAEAAADVARADAMMGADANAQMDAANRIAEASGNSADNGAADQ
ncbi:hypothetical protein [Sphingomonas sp.]|uniref:hypothetical protein n=1 Tax=Sphingomonas sp. TaxID=28214 RepID=UPI001D2235C0|nr:hypothetical protein [Sphingomonas sp.]MBX9795956.1 hypothetical protein [Sphingomonas sp.]